MGAKRTYISLKERTKKSSRSGVKGGMADDYLVSGRGAATVQTKTCTRGGTGRSAVWARDSPWEAEGWKAIWRGGFEDCQWKVAEGGRRFMKRGNGNVASPSCPKVKLESKGGRGYIPTVPTKGTSKGTFPQRPGLNPAGHPPQGPQASHAKKHARMDCTGVSDIATRSAHAWHA